MFKDLETGAVGARISLDALVAALRFDDRGLIPAVAQQHDTKEVLMLAWMNHAAVTETLTTRQVCYYSRSRQALWRKGEVSGNRQILVELRVDCDGDTLLLLVQQNGPACHTGRHTCFYTRSCDDGDAEVFLPIEVPPEDMYRGG